MRHLTTIIIVAATTSLGACHATLSPQTRNDISIQVGGTHKALQACYREALKRDKDLAGNATLTFVVTPDGAFSNAQLGDSVNDAELKSCVAGHVSSLKLANPSGKPILVSYPLSFEPEPI